MRHLTALSIAALALLGASTTLAARGTSPAAFGGRGIPPGGVAPPSNTGGIFGCRAWPAGRLARLDATRHLCHGLPAQNDGWMPIFDGKTLDGWKVGENAATFTVRDGAIVVNGLRAHLYYTGTVQNHDFKNFEFKAEVMTTPGSNSGIYFHTAYQEDGWPAKGYEVQVNNSHTDPKRTGGLYSIQDVFEAPAKDNEWFTEHIIVQGNRVRVEVNGKQLVDYTQPADVKRPPDMAGRVLSSGTFALQGHDPKSTVHFRNIAVKPLP